MKRRSILGAAALAALTTAFNPVGAYAQDDQYTIALIPGLTTDAFYITMQRGAQAAADALGVELVFQGAPRTSTR
jgi:ribose transport system substrate-binding protein